MLEKFKKVTITGNFGFALEENSVGEITLLESFRSEFTANF